MNSHIILFLEDGDQARILTSTKTLNSRSGNLVRGRPITASPNPLESREDILKEIKL
tara:strand:- start:3511 stop:3681 length:171 start_codon:yes stop_codon:yes gene_type:complete